MPTCCREFAKSCQIVPGEAAAATDTILATKRLLAKDWLQQYIGVFRFGPRMDSERTPNEPRTDAKRTPNEPRTDLARTPYPPRTDLERTPNRPRTDPERTPNGFRMDPERSPNRSRTEPERIPNGPRCYEIFSETGLI